MVVQSVGFFRTWLETPGDRFSHCTAQIIAHTLKREKNHWLDKIKEMLCVQKEKFAFSPLILLRNEPEDQCINLVRPKSKKFKELQL